MFKRWSRILSLAAAALLVSLTAWAQSSTTGVIEGRVRDQAGNAIADATVSAVANRAPASTVADGQGRYNLANLPPGEYTIRAEAPGKSAVVLDGVVVSINTRTRVDLTLVTGQAETVTVTAEAPTVDTKSVTTGGNFKVANFIDQIPVGRNLAATLTLAPGVEGGGGTGAGNYSISGSSGLENSYIVDGVNITSTGYGGIGTFNNVYGSLGTGVTYDFLEEVQVKTGGIDVEFGQATGGVVNTVVKSGTNDLSGSVAFYTGAPINEYKQADFFIGAVNNQKGSWNDNADYDLGLSVGGPILKDKLFYFVAYNPVMGRDTAAIQDIPLPQISTLDPTLAPLAPFDPTPQYPAALAGNQTRERRSDNYAAKLTWYANPNHRLELSAFGDPSSGDLGVQRFSLRNIDFAQGGGLSEISYGANNFNLKYDAVFTPTLFMQAMIGRHDGKFEETSALNRSRYTDDRQLRCFLSPNFCAPGQSRDNAARWANGGVGFISNSSDLNDQFKAVVTWVAGNNELKGGVSYDKIEYSDHQDYSGTNIPVKFSVNADGVPGIATTALTTPPCVGTGDTTDCFILLDTRGGVVANVRQDSAGALGFRTTRGRYNPNPGPTTTDDMAVFLQDTFTFAQNWTLKAGVRASQQEISGEGNYTLQYYLWDGNQIPVTKTPTNLRTTASGTPTTYKFDWAFAPRLGLIWDTKGDGRSKLYANLARYYERVPNDLAIRALSNESGFGTVTYNNWDLNGETGGIVGAPDWQSARNFGSFRGGQTRVEDGTKLPYVDEYMIGWQQEVGRDTSVELRGIYREQGRALEDVQFNSVEATENYYANYYFTTDQGLTLDTVPFPNDPQGPAGAPFGEYVLANPGENTSAGFPKAERKYYALEAILNKRFGDHWLFYGNMRFARLQGNYEGLFRNDNGQSDPNITSLFDFPNSPILAGQFDSGPLNTDRPFSMKLYGSYQWDNGINLGAALNVAAGTPRTPLLAHPNGFYQNAGEVPGASPIYYWYSSQQPGAPLGTPCAAADLCLTTGTADEFFRDVDANTAPGSWAFPHLYDYAKVGRGANGRTNTEYQIDLSLGWSHQFNRWATLAFGATVFNVLNSRETTTFNDNIELQAGVTDPDYLKQSGFQNPRNVRAYAKWSF